MQKKTPKKHVDLDGKLADAVNPTKQPVEIEQPKRLEPQRSQGSPEWWAIVVLGNMDPRQNHPMWYELVKAITEKERKNSDGIVVTQTLAAFDVGDFAVVVQPDRWQIQTITKENQQRLVSVATIVLNKIEVSVSAFGINCQLNVLTKTDQVRKIFRNRLLAAEIGLEHDDTATGSISWATHTPTYTRQLTVFPSPESDSRFIAAFNYHRPVTFDKGYKYIDVSNMINPFAKDCWSQAEQVAARIAERINVLAEDQK